MYYIVFLDQRWVCTEFLALQEFEKTDGLMKTLLDQSRQKLGNPPRKISFFQKLFTKLPKKGWILKSGTGLEKVYEDQGLLMEKGKVIWGAVVIANEVLWQGDDDATAAIIFSMDSYYDDNLKDLLSLAKLINKIAKSGTTKYDPALKPVIDSIISRNTPLFNSQLPESFTDGRKVYFTVLPVFLKHLPFPVLQQGWFPMLAHPAKTNMTMVLPYKYWVNKLQDNWFQG